jgi:hypothetical protein
MSALIDWLATLDPAFAFLLALPFIVAAAALCADAVRAARAGAPMRTEEDRRYTPVRREHRSGTEVAT